jgi:hypothetical protein
MGQYLDKLDPQGDHSFMGKAAKNPPRSGAPLEPSKTPNRKTREAMQAAERGEVESCQDADDLLKKLKS